MSNCDKLHHLAKQTSVKVTVRKTPFRDWKLIGLQPGGWYLFLVRDVPEHPEYASVAVYHAGSGVLYVGLKLGSVMAHDPYWREVK